MQNQSQQRRLKMNNKDHSYFQISDKEIIFKRGAKYSKPHIVLGLVLIFLCSLKTVQAVTSVPLTYDPQQNMESQMKKFYTSGSYVDSFIISYAKPRQIPPSYDNVFMALAEMDYIMNTPNNPWGGNLYILYYEIYFNIYSSYTRVYLWHMENRVNFITVSVLIFHNQFVASNMVEGFYLWFDINGGTYQQIPLSSSNYTVLRYLTYIDLQTVPSDTTLSIHFDMNYTSPYYGATITFGSTYQYAYLGVRFIAIYHDIVPINKIKIQIYNGPWTTPPLTIGVPLGYYNTLNSYYLIGLTTFRYDVVNNPSNPGFNFQISIIGGNTFQLDIDDQFGRINYYIFLINFIECGDPLYPLRGFNSSTGAEQCFDQCYSNYYIGVKPIQNYLICTQCADPLCQTCQNNLTCSSCIPNYDLDQSGLCNVNKAYYIGSIGSTAVYPCSNALPACLYCTSTGSSCIQCSPGYYYTGSSCSTCTSVVTYCNQCNSTACFACLPPNVLINSTLCSSPLSPFTPTNPPPILPCTDSSCSVCSQPNVGNCLLCNSYLLTLQNGKCVSPCGDGIIAGSDVCDDGNSIDYDGCSSDCLRIEDGFTCSRVSSILAGFDRSICYFSKKIELKVLSIKKQLKQNKLNIIIKNSQTSIKEWKQMELNNELNNVFNVSIPNLSAENGGYEIKYNVQFIKSLQKIENIKAEYQSKDFNSKSSRLLQTSYQFSPNLYQYILLQLFYSYNPSSSVSINNLQSLNHQQVSLILNPSLSQRSIFTHLPLVVSSTSTFYLITDDNHIIQYHSEEYYQNVDKVKSLGLIISILTISIYLIAFITYFLDGHNSKNILIALQTIFIVQFAYFSLIGIGQLNPLFISMAEGLKYTSGFDLELGKGTIPPNYMQGVGISSIDLADNVNISLILVAIFVICGSFSLLIDKIINKTSTQQQSQSQNQNIEENQSKSQKTKCRKISEFLVFNIGFSLFLFFLYKLLTFTALQVFEQMKSLTGFDVILIGLIAFFLIGFFIVLLLRLQLFQTFISKVKNNQKKISIFDRLNNIPQLTGQSIKKIQKRFQMYLQMLPDSDKPESMRKITSQTTTINIKFWYIIWLFIQHIVNAFVLVALGQSFAYHQLVPIILYLGNIFLAVRYRFYNNSNLWRLYFTNFIGIAMQCIFLAQSVLMKNTSQISGGSQTSIGLYFPYSILILSFVLCITCIVYQIYSIKKIRCCQLQIEWQRIDMTVAMKLKLQGLIQLELLAKSHPHQILDQNDLQKQLRLQCRKHSDSSELTDHLGPGKDQYTSFNSNESRNLLNLHLSIQKPVKGILSMIQSSKKGKLSNKLDDFTDIEINQETTTKSLKKQIKQKLTTLKIQSKLKAMAAGKSDTIAILKFFQQPMKKPEQISEQKPEQDIKQTDQSLLNKSLFLSPGIKSNLPHLRSANKNRLQKDETQNLHDQDQLGYIYTDTKIYDTYQQFDMI